MKRLIVVTNRPQDSLFFFSLKTLIQGYVKDCTCFDLSSIKVSDNTLDAGYVAEQAVLQEEKNGSSRESVCLVFVDSVSPEVQPGVIMKLNSGMTVIGPNAGHALSFVKPYVEKAYSYEPLQNVSLRKGLEEYGRIVAHLIDYEDEEMELLDQPLEVIHDLHEYFICHQPVPHVFHTNMPKGAMKGVSFGESVKLTIGEKEISCEFAEAVDEKKGAISLVIGEYGHSDDPYIKLYAPQDFSIGSPIRLT